jgi:hypothetical protein
MPRSLCIPGVFFLFAAFVLLFIVSVSLPYLTAMDIARTHFATAVNDDATTDSVNQIRLGIWAYCSKAASDATSICLKTGHGYAVPVHSGSNVIVIGANWTRGLAIHPVACGVAFIALLLSLSSHITVTLVASIVSFLAAVIAFIAFIVDIALYAYVKHEMTKLHAGANTLTGPGFWLTFVSFILLTLAGCTVCFGRRKDRLAGASTQSSEKHGFLSRFRRKRNVV